MNIGRLTEQDLPLLSELFKQFWGESSSLEKMSATFSRLVINPSYILLAAKQNGRLVGFTMGVICEELYGDCQHFMVMEDLIVDEKLRRSGIGAALMRELENCAVDFNCCQIIFITEADRSDALRFYKSLGFNYEPYKGFKKQIGIPGIN